MKKISTIAASAAVAFSAISFAPTAPQAQGQSCAGDNNGDGVVNGVDLAQVLANWGACGLTAPIISSVTPSFGPAAGGTAITILGTSLSTVTSVTIGGVAATNVVVVSATVVTAVAPAGTGGAKNVVVITPNSSATAIGAFTYSSGLAWATVLEWIPNPAVVTDANLRAAITASGLPWRVLDNGTNIELLLVPSGTFMMGCSPGDTECLSDESPTHQVTLTNAFYMGKTEVTQAQWLAKMGSNPSVHTGNTQFPVEMVSWTMVQSFNTATGFRLTTEAEWEFACRAGTTTATYGVLNDIAWYGGNNSPYGSKPVATKLPNALGLYDTIGNVFEWNQDWYGPYSSASVANPTGPTSGSTRSVRGLGWYNAATQCRASGRYGRPPTDVDGIIGFRVARNP